MSEPNSGNTISLGVEPLVPGYPAVVDNYFSPAVRASEAGGAGTQEYFDSQNQTSDFWNQMASGAVTFATGVDPAGRAVVMASSGNVELRVQAIWTGESIPGKVGILTLATREVNGSGISREMTAGVVVKDNPSSAEIDETIFGKLLPALYESTENMLVALAASLSDASRVESPEVDAESLTAKVLYTAGQKAIGIGATLVEYGLDWAAVAWEAVLAEALGVGALMSIPTIVEFLGHQMSHSMQVQNLSGIDFTWEATTLHGVTTLKVPAAVIPALASNANPLAPDTQLVLASELHQLYSNYNEWGSIGYVFRLTPKDGSPQAQVLVSIPWVGQNIIWVGESSESTQKVWNTHQSSAPAALSLKANIGESYTVTVSLNRLGGREEGVYFYCSSILIQPL